MGTNNVHIKYMIYPLYHAPKGTPSECQVCCAAQHCVLQLTQENIFLHCAESIINFVSTTKNTAKYNQLLQVILAPTTNKSVLKLSEIRPVMYTIVSLRSIIHAQSMTQGQAEEATATGDVALIQQWIRLPCIAPTVFLSIIPNKISP